MADLVRTEQEKVIEKYMNQSSDILSTFIKDTEMLDVIFMFDTTGSMYSYLESVRQNLVRLTSKINSEIPDVYFGVVAYGDHCDADTTYVTKICQLTFDVNIIKNFIAIVEPTDGGDEPEALEDALYESNRLNWREQSNKCIVLVGDAPPHGVMDSFNECPRGIDYREETRNLSDVGVKIYSVLCNNVHQTEVTFKWLADQTNGKFLKLENIDDLVDLIVAVCMKETGSLASFENKLIESGEMTKSKKRLLLGLK
ncbi:MAG: hypothetical protein AEth_01114 [Candidatus Argoarchaeum ethanivorans]|uniref:VWFA domain-containing protein n=1 Tax=Candidatus Argoarchaeum ethanivorans TaxID=2608793 RepID=A0A8B3S156_9EURY|nr:MAG: hypothetical protein AEth_01114 [Candidatus Argoarchaeum ethanivorans]